MIATRSRRSQPRSLNRWAVLLARPFKVEKSTMLSPRIKAGLFGLLSAWTLRKSMSAMREDRRPPRLGCACGGAHLPQVGEARPRLAAPAAAAPSPHGGEARPIYFGGAG